MPILTFNKEQEAAVIGKRRAHNARQERLAKESEGELIGNAYTIPRGLPTTKI